MIAERRSPGGRAASHDIGTQRLFITEQRDHHSEKPIQRYLSKHLKASSQVQASPHPMLWNSSLRRFPSGVGINCASLRGQGYPGWRGGVLACVVSPTEKNTLFITTCPAEAQRGHTKAGKHGTAKKGKAKLERGEEEKRQELCSNTALFKTLSGTRYKLKHSNSS